MPHAPPRACAESGCANLVRERGERYCPESKARRNRSIDLRRGSSSERGYDARWQRFRVQFLREHPLCEMACREQGRVTAATVVDHIVPIAHAPERRFDPANLRAACKPCHDARTMRDQVPRSST